MLPHVNELVAVTNNLDFFNYGGCNNHFVATISPRVNSVVSTSLERK